MACSHDRIVGVLPLFFVRSFLVGNTAMTMPGGLCAEDDQAAEALLARASELARQRGMKRLMIQDSRQAWLANLHRVSHHVHWTIDVSVGAEALWASLHRNIRRQVRLAIKNELAVEIDRTDQALSQFYEVFARFTHQAGTPVFSPRFLEQVVEVFPGGFNIVLVRKHEQPIGGYFQLVMGDTVYGMWGASLPEYLQLRPVYLAYWELLKDTADLGYHYLDMGRSPAGSNASKFKGQWGGVDKPIYQLSLAFDERGIATSPVERVRTNGKMQLVSRVWPKLPLALANALGPRLRRHVPFA
jgi:FemAB-related protein (PEP-CTERM system-associated)